MRAGNILELFIGARNPIGISELSQRLSLPKTTIQGIVTTLAELRYLEKDPSSSRYRLGGKLFQLGLSYANNLDIVTIARAWIERLSYKFREPVNVGMLVGSQVLIIFRSEPENRFMAFPQTGSVIPAHTTCIGKLLFANMNRKKRDSVLNNYNFESLTKNSITDKLAFEKVLDSVRNDGIAFENEENFIGLVGIGGPIYNQNGEVIAAFALSGDSANINKNRQPIIDEVKYSSREISFQFGYSRKNTLISPE